MSGNNISISMDNRGDSVAENNICKKCGKKDDYFLIINNCQKGDVCELSDVYRCELYNGPEFLCYKCGNDPNTIFWLTANSCQESGKNTSLDIYNGYIAVDEVEIDKWMLKKGNMERIDVHVNGLYKDEHPRWIELEMHHLGRIIESVPEYKIKIISKLLKHEECTSFNEKQAVLIDFFILRFLESNCSELTDEKEISEFIIKKKGLFNPKTKKRIKKLLKKYGLK